MNIYCFSTLSFAKLQFKSVINKVFHKHGVASFTDAWIETGIFGSIGASRRRSHLLQMRGLKLKARKRERDHLVASFTDAWIETCFYPWNDFPLHVASFTDAWIETEINDINEHVNLSHLLQMRGLKQQDQKYDDAQRMSHLLQMRGLKLLYREGYRTRRQVASFTDAWIETVSWWHCEKTLGRIFYRCVD